MIGDAIPHPPSYPLNTLKLDWKKEAKQLYDDLGVRVYAVQVHVHIQCIFIAIENTLMCISCLHTVKNSKVH